MTQNQKRALIEGQPVLVVIGLFQEFRDFRKKIGIISWF